MKEKIIKSAMAQEIEQEMRKYYINEVVTMIGVFVLGIVIFPVVLIVEGYLIFNCIEDYFGGKAGIVSVVIIYALEFGISYIIGKTREEIIWKKDYRARDIGMRYVRREKESCSQERFEKLEAEKVTRKYIYGYVKKEDLSAIDYVIDCSEDEQLIWIKFSV